MHQAHTYVVVSQKGVSVTYIVWSTHTSFILLPVHLGPLRSSLGELDVVIESFFSKSFRAFGTHALKNRLTPHQFSSWQTATSYQIVHSIALLVASSQPSNSAVQIASYAFTSGITLFSGSIYGLCLTSEGNAWRKLLGPATPIGGAALIIGWLALALSKRGGNNVRL